MHANRVSFLFFPHHLSHLIGLDIHDVGGYLKHTPPKSDVLGLDSLKTTRTLEKNLVFSVEPGIYFINPLLNGEIEDTHSVKLSYLNRELIEEYKKEV